MHLRRILALTTILTCVIVAAWLFLTRAEGEMDESRPRSSLLSRRPEQINDNVNQVNSAIDLSPARPSSIDLGTDLEVPDEFRSQYERWQDGDIDLGEIESFVSEEQRKRLVDQSSLLEPNELIQNLGSAQTSTSVLETGFDSLDIGQCCGQGGANVPPDPIIAVGPTRVIAAVNVSFEIYDKSGNVLIPATTFAALFSGEDKVEGCIRTLFDPSVLYDEQADRFILAIDGAGDYYCMAVSKTADPTGEWWRYRFPANQNNLSFDYPQAGVGRDAIYMGGNMFAGDGFAEARVWAFDKWAMYAGEEARFRSHAVRRLSANAPEEDTPQPANLHGYKQGTWPDSEPHYFLTETDFNGATYSVYQWADPFGGNNFDYVGTFDLEEATGINIGMPVPVTQDESFPLITNDWRLQDAEYRNDTIWTTDTVACNRNGQILNCIRWAQIEPETAEVIQAGVTTGDGHHRFYGDLAANHCGDMAVGYSKLGQNGFVGVWTAGRSNDQRPGLLHSETRLKAGELPYTAFDGLQHNPPSYRWGDYTGMTSDPNGRDFWYIGQYSKDTGDPNGRWGTYIGCFIATSCVPQADESSGQQGSLSPLSGNSYTVTMPIIANRDYYPCGTIFD